MAISRGTIVGLAVAAVTAVTAVATAYPSEAGMQRFQWQNRPLLVFAPVAESPDLQRQLAIARDHAAGWRERDMVTIVVAGDRPVTVDRTRAKDLSNAALRRRFQVAGDRFAAILVGKDGTEKLRHDAPIPAAKLFQTIDAMPMRRREMRKQEG